MATLTQVEDALAPLLTVSGRLPVQGRAGEAAAPDVPYTLWDLDSLELTDFPVVKIEGANQIIIAANTPLEFVLNFVGGNAMADAVTFGLSLRQSQRTADLYKLCGLSGLSPMRDLSAVETGTFRQRVEVRLTLFAAVDLTVAAELIETSCVQVREASKEFDETYCVTEGECR